MTHTVTIAGQPVQLTWTNETEKRFRYRLGTIGGHPTQAQFRNHATSPAAFCKVLWALLPAAILPTYPTPEDLFVAIDHESEGESIATALVAIYADMAPDPEKKSTSANSPSPALNSA